MSNNLSIVAGNYNTDVDGMWQRVYRETEDRGYTHLASTSYPSNGLDLTEARYSISNGGYKTGIFSYDDIGTSGLNAWYLYIRYEHGKINATSFNTSAKKADEALVRSKTYAPETEIAEDSTDLSANFWMSDNGGTSIVRTIDGVKWEEVEGNYPIRKDLAHIMSPDWRPSSAGQLIIWHGVAGTGKTSAIRSLAHEWRSWISLHDVMDPERFFGSSSYMMKVLMNNDDSPSSKWRLIILEDSGELIRADAKQETGQGLSRLLNACDGLIGRGLKFIILITTNEELRKLHPAVRRPGRCAGIVEFDRFSPDGAKAWLESHGHESDGIDEPKTLGELYAILNNIPVDEEQLAVGFAR